MATTMIARTNEEKRHERWYARLWPLEPRHRQFRRVHRFRLQLLQADDVARLALVRRLQRLSGGALRRDVRLPSHDLFPIRMAAVAFPWRRLVLPRRGTSAGDDVRLEDESTRGSLPHPQLRV